MSPLSYWVAWLPWAVAVIGVGVCAAYDLRHRRIPNLVLAVMLTLAIGLGASRSLSSGSVFPVLRVAAGGLLVSLVPLALWRVHLMGAGDVKLCAVLGALVGAKLGLLCTSGGFTVGLTWLIMKAAFYGSAPWRSLSLVVNSGAAPGPLGRRFLRRALASVQPSMAQTMPFAPALVVSVLGLAVVVWVTGWQA